MSPGILSNRKCYYFFRICGFKFCNIVKLFFRAMLTKYVYFLFYSNSNNNHANRHLNVMYVPVNILLIIKLWKQTTFITEIKIFPKSLQNISENRIIQSKIGWKCKWVNFCMLEFISAVHFIIFCCLKFDTKAWHPCFFSFLFFRIHKTYTKYKLNNSYCFPYASFQSVK